MNFSQKIINFALKIYKFSFTKIMRQTMIILFPFAALGSIASVISVSILSNTGFIGNIFYITKWLPHIARIRSMFAAFSMLTTKAISVLGAYEAASLTEKMYHRRSNVVGLTGMLAFLIIALKPVQRQYGAQKFLHFEVNDNLMGIQGILIGIIVGFLTAQIFRFIKVKNKELKKAPKVFQKTSQNILPIMITLTVAILLNQLIIEIYRYQLPTTVSTYYQNLSSKKHGFVMTLILGAWSSFLAWLGLSGPYNQKSFTDDPAAVADLTYALKHYSPWNVPYKYTQTTLYHSFGTFGGVGSTLSLVIAIIIVARTTQYHEVARWSLFPVLFNVNQPILLGIPVLFDPIYLIPFVLTPVFNMVVAALTIYLKLMPPVTYPTPLDTPGVLTAFIGTGGHLTALVVGLIVMVLDVLIYIPFVKLSETVKKQVKWVD